MEGEIKAMAQKYRYYLASNKAAVLNTVEVWEDMALLAEAVVELRRELVEEVAKSRLTNL